jgi:hypothetical protein
MLETWSSSFLHFLSLFDFNLFIAFFTFLLRVRFQCFVT